MIRAIALAAMLGALVAGVAVYAISPPGWRNGITPLFGGLDRGAETVAEESFSTRQILPSMHIAMVKLRHRAVAVQEGLQQRHHVSAASLQCRAARSVP
jgi:hypothetical protein